MTEFEKNVLAILSDIGLLLGVIIGLVIAVGTLVVLIP